MLDDLGLMPAAEWLVQNFTQRTGIPCELDRRSADLDLHDPHATAIFRILQESLTNVAQACHASDVEVTRRRASGRRNCAARARQRLRLRARRRRASPTRSASSGCASAPTCSAAKSRSTARPARAHASRCAFLRRTGPRPHDPHRYCRRSHDRPRRAEAAAGRGRRPQVVGEAQNGNEVHAARARTRLRRAAARHVDAGQERHRTDQAGARRKAEAAHPGASACTRSSNTRCARSRPVPPAT